MRVMRSFATMQVAKLIVVILAGCGNLPVSTAECVNADGDLNPDGSDRCDGFDDPYVADGPYLMIHESVAPPGATMAYLYGDGFGGTNDWCEPRHQFSVMRYPATDERWFKILLTDTSDVYYVNGGTADACGVTRNNYTRWFNNTVEMAKGDEFVWPAESGGEVNLCIAVWNGLLLPGDCSAFDD